MKYLFFCLVSCLMGMRAFAEGSLVTEPRVNLNNYVTCPWTQVNVNGEIVQDMPRCTTGFLTAYAVFDRWYAKAKSVAGADFGNELKTLGSCRTGGGSTAITTAGIIIRYDVTVPEGQTRHVKIDESIVREKVIGGYRGGYPQFTAHYIIQRVSDGSVLCRK